MTDNVSYVLGPSVAWLSSSRPAIIGIEILIMAGLMVLAWRGLDRVVSVTTGRLASESDPQATAAPKQDASACG